MDVGQKEPPILSMDQSTVHNHVYKFYSDLLFHNECNKDYSALKDFMKNIKFGTITQKENLQLE